MESKENIVALHTCISARKLVNIFLEADIPLHKLRDEGIKYLFASYKPPLSSVSLTYSMINSIYEDKMKELRKLLFEKELFLVIDEPSKKRISMLPTN